MKSPTEYQFIQLKQLVSYLMATKEVYLLYGDANGDCKVHTFTDAGEVNLIFFSSLI